jgi:hypothetical protein
LIETGLWSEGRTIAGVAQHTNHAPHLGQRLATGLLHSGQRV